jgi:ribosomal protein S12 methylthiotransferase
MIYTHPKHFSHSLIDLIAGEPRICKYIDLPIQHINDRILKLMNRGVTKKEIKTLIETIRKRIPGCHIRTSLIVGFPSETQKEFNELVDFVEEIKFEKLGVFTYSREEGTPAFRYSGQIHQKTKEARRDAMMTIQKEISLKVNEKFIDKETTVLVDEKNKDSCIGRTQYDAYEVDGAVILPAGGFIPGKFYKVTVTDALEYDLVAG